MIPRLRFSVLVLSLVWLLLSNSLFSPFRSLAALGLSPVVSVGYGDTHNTGGAASLPSSTPSALHRFCIEDLAWVRSSSHPHGYESPFFWVKRQSLSPVSIRVHLSYRRALSSPSMGLRASISFTYIDPILTSSWLDSLDHYRNSSIFLLHLEKVLTSVLCPGPLEAMVVIPDEHIIRSSLILDTSSVQATQTAISSLSLWLEFISSRCCSFFWNSEKSICETSGFIPVISLVMGHSKGLYSSNPARGYNLSHCSSRQERYYLTTPFVQNLNSKFSVDIGVLHGLNSVMVKGYLSYGVSIWLVVLSCDSRNHQCPSVHDRYDIHKSIVLNLIFKLFLVNFGLACHGFCEFQNPVVTIVLHPILSAGRLLLIFDQVCYRVCTAFLTGFYISVSFSRAILDESPDVLQRYTKLLAMTFGFGDKLGRMGHMKGIFGLCLISAESLIYLLTQKDIHRSFQSSRNLKYYLLNQKTIQRSLSQKDLKHYLSIWVSMVKNLILLLCKWKIESLDLYYPKM